MERGGKWKAYFPSFSPIRKAANEKGGFHQHYEIKDKNKKNLKWLTSL